MPYCDPCERWFNTNNGYNQHIENSAAHQYEEEEWDCDVCDRTFGSEYALQQHCANSSGHPWCASCKRIFQNENNLMQVSLFWGIWPLNCWRSLVFRKVFFPGSIHS